MKRTTKTLLASFLLLSVFAFYPVLYLSSLCYAQSTGPTAETLNPPFPASEANLENWHHGDLWADYENAQIQEYIRALTAQIVQNQAENTAAIVAMSESIGAMAQSISAMHSALGSLAESLSYYVSIFSKNIHPVSFPEIPFNINTATEIEFVDAMKMDAVTAANIVAYREENGPFQTVDDLAKVVGIDRVMIDYCRPFLTTFDK